MEEISYKGKEWIFNALWAACSDSKGPRCTVDVPITIIFRDGLPFKLIRPDKQSRVLKCTLISEISEEEGSKYNGDVASLKMCLNLLLHYLEDRGYLDQDCEEPYICTVTYVDGDREHLTQRKFNSLSHNDTWRIQVMLLQGFVPIVQTLTGNYTHDPKKLERIEDMTEVELMARSLAKCAERAYSGMKPSRLASKLSSSSGFDFDVFDSSDGSSVGSISVRSKRRDEKDVVIHVRNINTVFGIDSLERKVLLYCDYVLIEVESGRSEVENFLKKERGGREAAAAETVSNELHQLLQHAQRRGMGAAHSFAHFDLHGTGVVDVNCFVEGLARLGIGVTYPIAEMVLQDMAGIGATFLTVQDFAIFMDRPDRNDDLTEKGAVGSDGTKTGHVADSSLGGRRFTWAHSGGENRKKSTVSTAPLDISFEETQLKVRENLGAEAHVKLAFEFDPATYVPMRRRQKQRSRGGSRTVTSRTGSSRQFPSHEEKQDHPVSLPITVSGSFSESDGLSEKQSPFPSPLPHLEATTSSSGTSPHRRRVAWEDGVPSSALATVAKDALVGIRGWPVGQDFGRVSESSPAAAIATSIGAVGSSMDELLHLESGVVMTYRIVFFEDTPYFDEHGSSSQETDGRRPKPTSARRNIESSGTVDSQRMESPHLSRATSSASAFGENDSEGLTGRGRNKRKKKGLGVYRAMSSSEVGGEGSGSAFTLVVVPDLFSSLEALQQQLQPLLVKYPLARLVLVGLPGLPNTLWPADWVLNSDLHARAIARLLQHLSAAPKAGDSGGQGAKVQLTSNNHEPVFLLGIGTGVNSLLRFASQLLPAMSALHQQVRAVCLVNGILKFNAGFRHICKDLRHGLLTASAQEVSELVTSLHLWDGYLANQGREEGLKLFWVPRRSLRSEGSSDENAGLGYVGVLEQLKAILISPDNFDGASLLSSSSLPVLVVQSTEDVFVNPRNASVFQPDQLPPERTLVTDLTQSLSAGAVHVSWLKAGHEVLQERNAFILGWLSGIAQVGGVVSADVVSMPTRFKEYMDLIEPDAESAEVDEFDESSIGRREDERKPATAQEHSREGSVEGEVNDDAEKKVKKPSFFLKLSALRSGETSSEIPAIPTPAELNELVRQRLSGYSDNHHGGGRNDEDDEDSLLSSPSKEAAPSTMEAQRRLRLLKQKTAAAIERRRLAVEREREDAELHAMHSEEQLKRYVDAENQRIANELERRRLKLLEIEERARLERERVLKEIEDRVRRKLAQRSADRRRKTSELVHRLQQSELTLMPAVSTAGFTATGFTSDEDKDVGATSAAATEDVQSITSSLSESVKKSSRNRLSKVRISAEGFKLLTHPSQRSVPLSSRVGVDDGDDGGDNSSRANTARNDERLLDIQMAIADAFQALKVLLHQHARAVEGTVRVQLILRNVQAVKKLREVADGESRRLERVISLLIANPWMVGAGFNAQAETDSLRKSLFKKDDVFAHYTDLTTLKEAQVEAARGSLRLLEAALKEKDDAMKVEIVSLQTTEHDLTNEIEDLRRQIDELTIGKDKARLREIVLRRRFESLRQELQRVKNHQEEYIDTDVWIEGYMQRHPTAKLSLSLTDEEKKVEDQLMDVTRELSDKSAQLQAVATALRRTERAHDLVSAGLRELLVVYNKVKSKKLEESAAELVAQEDSAHSLEDKRERNQSFSRLAALLGAVSTVDRVRIKDAELRSKDEKHFVALDLVMFPEVYVHLSPADAEMLKYDQDYHTELTKVDLDRIYSLPEQISLALPFLHTQQEVTAHRLLNMFWRGQDEAFYQEKDFNSFSRDDPASAQSILRAASIDSAAGGAAEPMQARTDGKLAVNVARRLRAREARHDVQLREQRRDRVRALGAGDVMTAEERAWLSMDLLLSPDVFAAEKNVWYVDEKFLPLPGSLPVGVRSQTAEDPVQTQTHNQEKFDFTDWRCPFTKEQLMDILRKLQRRREMELSLNSTRDVDDADDKGHEQGNIVEDEDSQRSVRRGTATTGVDGVLPTFDEEAEERGVVLEEEEMDSPDPDTLKAQYLMKKYFVDDDESVLGHQRLKLLLQLAQRISAHLRKKNLIRDKESSQLLGTARSLDDAPSVATDITSMPGIALTSNSVDVTKTLTTSSTVQTEDRVWGSWEQVHPASAGTLSQSDYFTKACYSAARDHPAAFAVHLQSAADDDDVEGNGSDGGDILPIDMDLCTPQEVQEVGLRQLLALPSARTWLRRNRRDSHFIVVESTSELSQMTKASVKGRIVLLERPKPTSLFETKHVMLSARQSRSHHFEVPERDDLNVLDITVTIVFQGEFGPYGYRPGRLAASLFRLPDDDHKSDGPSRKLPMPVGYAPHALQAPNLPESIGRIVILHRPRARPLKPGMYRLVIGAASKVHYTVNVTCKYAQAALPIVDEGITAARQMQNRLTNCLAEIENVEETIRLAERKLVVCRKLIVEAQVESQRCQKEVKTAAIKLEKDDEQMLLSEFERNNLEKSLKSLETEYVLWASAFVSRTAEHEDISHGITKLYELKRQRVDEKTQLKKDLEKARAELPACIAVLRSFVEAANTAASLNATIPPRTEDTGSDAPQTGGDVGILRVVTPAEEVRKRMRQLGFKALSLEEQKWALLDRALYPMKYEWLREQEDAEEEQRLAMGKKKRSKKQKLSSAVEGFRLSKVEIEHIMKAPFTTLSRKEVLVRKLLTKFHDDAELVRRGATAATYGFDPHLAERTRAKHPSTYTQEDAEWVYMDQILHPEVWAYYVKKDKEQEYRDRMAAGQERAIARDAEKRRPSKLAQAGKTTNYTSVLGRLLGIDEAVVSEIKDELGSQASANLGTFADIAHRKALEAKTKIWKCKWPKEEIMRVWSTQRKKLATDEERHAFDLLQKYSGTYKSYVDANSSWNKRHADRYLKSIGNNINFKKSGKVSSSDVDFRARKVLRELDRAEATTSLWMDTDAIHDNDHRYATDLLKNQLLDELDEILAEQIRDSERAHRKNLDSSDEDSDSSEGGLSDDVVLEDVDVEDAFQRKIEQDERAARRARRQRRAIKLQELEKVKEKRMVKIKNKSGEALIEAVLQNLLGPGGCIACRNNPCKWEPSIDEAICNERYRILEDEMQRVKWDLESTIFESTIALSAQLGGNTSFRRLDLMYELSTELRDLKRYIDLNAVDKELHDAYATRKEYIEVKHLSGFSAILWTNNARVALQQRQNRLVAETVAKEAVDDILDWMLEGWYFGERESNFSALGYVPSLKPGAKERVRAGQDQIRTVGAVIQKMKVRAEAKKKGIILDEFRRGVVVEKSRGIDASSQLNLIAAKIVKEGEDQKHLLNETENTLRFGLFMMTLMYFRCMALLRREKRSWSGVDDDVNREKHDKKTAPKLSLERMRMVDEERNAAARKRRFDRAMDRARIGEAIKKERYDRERREEIQRRQAIVRRKKLEDKSARLIQRIVRGYWGRLAARRWALKRAEWEAMKAVMNAAATTLQRRWRGVLGRRRYRAVRIEMAQFIAIVRMREADEDEQEFWQTHPWRRFKRNAREWVAHRATGILADKRIVYGAPNIADEDDTRTLRDAVTDTAKDLARAVAKLAPGAAERERRQKEIREKEEYLSDDGLEDEVDYYPLSRPPPPTDMATASSGDDGADASTGAGTGDDQSAILSNRSNTSSVSRSSRHRPRRQKKGRRARSIGTDGDTDTDIDGVSKSYSEELEGGGLKKKTKRKGKPKNVRIMDEVTVMPLAPINEGLAPINESFVPAEEALTGIAQSGSSPLAQRKS